MNQNIEPNTFFLKGKSLFLAEIRDCSVCRKQSCGYNILLINNRNQIQKPS